MAARLLWISLLASSVWGPLLPLAVAAPPAGPKPPAGTRPTEAQQLDALRRQIEASKDALRARDPAAARRIEELLRRVESGQLGVDALDPADARRMEELLRLRSARPSGRGQPQTGAAVIVPGGAPANLPGQPGADASKPPRKSKQEKRAAVRRAIEERNRQKPHAAQAADPPPAPRKPLAP